MNVSPGVLTRRNLAANKGRLIITGLAITLGVGFVVASFLLSDGLKDSFGSLSQEVTSGVDIGVRPEQGTTVDSVDQTVLDAIAATPGVESANGIVRGNVRPVAPSGEPLPDQGPPTIGFAWVDGPTTEGGVLVEGTAPGVGQFVIDVDSAATHGFTVGERYTMLSKTGVFEYELSGVFRFGENNDTLGAVLTGYDIADARILTGAEPGTFDAVEVQVANNATSADVIGSLETVLPAGYEAVNRQTLEQETAAEFNQIIDVIRNIFLGFAGVSLFVSIFIIYNTFGVLLAQRIRETGLLRAIGASPSQIRRVVIGEAVLIGVAASVVGIGAGIAIQTALLAAFDLIGFAVPETDLILAPRTIIVGLAVGIGATLVSALLPALRAGTVSPMVALTGAATSTGRGGRGGVFTAVAVGAVGVGLGVIGLQGIGGTTVVVTTLALGAIAVFVAATMLSPFAIGPTVGLLNRPMTAVAGASGDLAVKNAIRNPSRTATTAGSLMIGLALVTTALVVGDSFKAQVSNTLESSTHADYLIQAGSQTMPPPAIADIEATPELSSVLTVAEGSGRIGDTFESDLLVADLATLSDHFDLSVEDGSLTDAADDAGAAVALPVNTAEEVGAGVGDRVIITVEEGGATAEYTVVATYSDETLIDGIVIDAAAMDGVSPVESWNWVTVMGGDGYTDAEVGAAVDSLVIAYPQLTVQGVDDYRQSIEGDIDFLLNLITMMLSLAIVIALIGIGLTLALSIMERTRELGLLRAVGMRPRQVRRMIRYEASVIAMFGAVMGIGLGLVFGWGVVNAIPESFLSTVSIPVGRLGIMVAVAALAGLAAALVPARRAGRMNVLDAIAG